MFEKVGGEGSSREGISRRMHAPGNTLTTLLFRTQATTRKIPPPKHDSYRIFAVGAPRAEGKKVFRPGVRHDESSLRHDDQRIQT